MKITGLRYVIKEVYQECNLENSMVVIDGQCFFNSSYRNSKLPLVFGSESNAYADYLRHCLRRYKEANVKCYFVFKGGNHNLEPKIELESTRQAHETLFMNDIIHQVIDEYEFEYVVCEFEIKKDCISIAQKFSCPVISSDIDYCFSGADYIPYDKTPRIKCSLFKVSNFLKHFQITQEVFIIFLVIVDEDIFPKNKLTRLFTSVKMPSKKIKSLLLQLGKYNRDEILQKILKNISKEDQKLFLDAEQKVSQLINNKENGGIPTSYLISNKNIDFESNPDQLWFEKGIALKYISIPYINMYHHKAVFNLNMYEDFRQEPALLFSIDIIKYAYDLLTNFKGGKIDLWYLKSIGQDKQESTLKQNQLSNNVFRPRYSNLFVTIDNSIRKPDYNATTCVFENGWESIKELGLFQHFLVEILQFNFEKLEKAPEDAKLLFIALVYFSRRKTINITYQIFSILLSYVTLSKVLENNFSDTITAETNDTSKPILDAIFDKNQVTNKDCGIAMTILKKYFVKPKTATSSGNKSNIKYSVLHSLLEFQHCLQQLNYLNGLCGVPFKPTIYSKTYNGTFVYSILELLTVKRSNNSGEIKTMLNPAPTVLAFFNGMIEIFEGLLY